jgi:hypothetical protein
MKPGNIIQNMRIRVTAILTATLETPPGADTQKMLNALGPEILKRIKDIPCVANVEAIDIEEVVPPMQSKMNH